MAIETVRPTGDGGLSGTWISPNAGCVAANVWQEVDEAAADDDTTYCITDGISGGSSCAVGTGTGQHSFVMANPSSIGAGDTINSVTVFWRAKRDGASASARCGIRESGSNSFGGTVALTASYATRSAAFAAKPGGGAWDLTALNNMEAIIESTALGAISEARVTWVYIDIDYTPAPVTTKHLLTLTGCGD